MQSAIEKACTNILPEIQKVLEIIYMKRFLWMQQVKRDLIHQKIVQARDAFVDNDVFDPEGAAIDEKKFPND